jgi:periplasmic protein TonB
MKQIISLFIFFCFAFTLFAQNKTQQVTTDDEIFDNKNVDTPAEFKGGKDTLMTWLRDNKEYPQKAIKKRIQGSVIVILAIDENGKVIDFYIESDTDKLLNKEALRVVSKLPNFSPAIHKGKKVKVYFELPITFGFRYK